MADKPAWAASGKQCPVEVTIDVIGGKWKMPILFWLKDRTLRFSELKRELPGVSERVLGQQLRQLERDGLIRREVFPEVPPRVEYTATEYGLTLRPLARMMCDWGLIHREKLEAAVDPG